MHQKGRLVLPATSDATCDAFHSRWQEDIDDIEEDIEDIEDIGVHIIRLIEICQHNVK